ncbi:hypothetical protein [Streptomyces sp. NPDC047097]|uniref:hypothetical protein n=1 Tax=Streptomyces sp. NPDC047097 TaxID=3155260 RepID=UPI0034095CEF
MTGPEDRLREALGAKAASIAAEDLSRPRPPSAAPRPGRILRHAPRTGALLALAAVLAAVLLLLPDTPARPPSPVPAGPSRPTLPGASASPDPSRPSSPSTPADAVPSPGQDRSPAGLRAR